MSGKAFQAVLTVALDLENYEKKNSERTCVDRAGDKEGEKTNGNKCKCKVDYPLSTKEFTRTRSELSVHSKIEIEFGNVGV